MVDSALMVSDRDCEVVLPRKPKQYSEFPLTTQVGFGDPVVFIPVFIPSRLRYVYPTPAAGRVGSGSGRGLMLVEVNSTSSACGLPKVECGVRRRVAAFESGVMPPHSKAAQEICVPFRGSL
jgi:hypothetical protein